MNQPKFSKSASKVNKWASIEVRPFFFSGAALQVLVNRIAEACGRPPPVVDCDPMHDTFWADSDVPGNGFTAHMNWGECSFGFERQDLRDKVFDYLNSLPPDALVPSDGDEQEPASDE